MMPCHLCHPCHPTRCAWTPPLPPVCKLAGPCPQNLVPIGLCFRCFHHHSFQYLSILQDDCAILFMDILHSYSQDPYIYMTCPARGHTRMLPQSRFSASFTIMKHSGMLTNCIQSHAEAMGPEGLLAWPEIQDPRTRWNIELW